MTLFRYSAFTPDGKIESGELEAQTTDEIAGRLASRGLTPFETKAVKSRSPPWRRPASSKWRLKEFAPFARELATLLAAELPLDDTLRILAGRKNSPRNAKLSESLLADVKNGMALSAALELRAVGAPRYVASLVRAGEARGTLAPTLAEIARLLEARAEIEARVQAALTYPLVLFAIASGTMAVVVIYLFPALLQLFDSSGIEPPTVLAIARDVAALLRDYWPVFLVLGIASVVAIITAFRRKSGADLFDRILLRLPLIGELRRQSAIAAFARTLGILVRNGVPLVQALQITGGVVSSRTMASGLIASAEALKEGSRLADALAKHGQLPEMAVRLVAIGEASGRLDTMLLHLADMSERDATRGVERAMTLLAPIITIGVGLIVGSIILSVMQAILAVNSLAVR